MSSLEPLMADSFIPNYWLCYRSNASLRTDVLRLIANLEGGSKESQKELASRALETAAYEVLQVLVGDLARHIHTTDAADSEIVRTLARLEGHIGSFCRLLTSILINEKILPVMHHFREMLIDREDSPGNVQPWVGFVVSEKLVDAILITREHLLDIGSTYNPTLPQATVGHIVDIVLHNLLETPKDLMRFGFVMRKTADGAISIIRSSMQGLIQRSLNELSLQQRFGLADYLEGLLHLQPDSLSVAR